MHPPHSAVRRPRPLQANLHPGASRLGGLGTAFQLSRQVKGAATWAIAASPAPRAVPARLRAVLVPQAKSDSETRFALRGKVMGSDHASPSHVRCEEPLVSALPRLETWPRESLGCSRGCVRVCGSLEGGFQRWGPGPQRHLARILSLLLGILTNTSANSSSLFLGFPAFKGTPLGGF